MVCAVVTCRTLAAGLLAFAGGLLVTAVTKPDGQGFRLADGCNSNELRYAPTANSWRR
jgi:hypothetical protein